MLESLRKCLKTTKNHIKILYFQIFFSTLYEGETTETVKNSKNKLKHNFRDSECYFRIKKEKKRR